MLGIGALALLTPAGGQAGGLAAPKASAPAAFGVQVTVVRSLASSGKGSLRAAIQLANRGPRRRVTLIDFTVHGVIRLRTALPAIARPTIIDGTSAPTHYRTGPPVVEVNCAGRAGLRFAIGSGGSELLALAVDDAGGDGVRLDASAITISGDYLGVNLAGRVFGNRGNGLYLARSSSRDLIGLNKSGSPGTVANVISGNGRNGIALHGSSRNTLVANHIGTNAAGTKAIPNRGSGLVLTDRSDGNEIGGTDFVDPATGKANNPTGSKGKTTPVFVVPPLGNLISGNRHAGVIISDRSARNKLNGNFIGTTMNGNAALGNGGNGVLIAGSNHTSLVGCRFVNNPFVYYNVISGNRGQGLEVTDARGTVVQGNFFGIGADNTAVLGNGKNGILVTGRSAGTQVGGVIPLGNVSAGNRLNGIAVTGRARGFETFNTFGGLLAFKGAAPNGRNGLLITSTGGDNLARTNVFSGNRGNGIELAGNASGVTIDPDIAGLSTNGMSALPNGGDGLLITGSAHANVVGGTIRSVIPQNTFSANAGYGIAIRGRAHGNRVFATFTGTQIFGVNALGNQRGGILIAGQAYRNVIGTPGSQRNLISGNFGIGVTLAPGTRLNRIIGNLVGLNRRHQPLPNAGRPIVNLGQLNVIRGNRVR